MANAYSLRTFRFCIEKLEERIALYGQDIGSEQINDLVSLASLVADDRFENNDNFTSASGLGNLSGGTKTFTNLTMDDAADFYKFNLTKAGTTNTKLFVTLLHSQGDLDVVIYNASGVQIRDSDTLTNQESVSLNGLAAGTYFVKVYGYRGAENPNYKLTLTTTGAVPTPIGPATPTTPTTPPPASPLIDLVGAALTVNNSSNWGSTISVSSRVSNIGSANSGAFNVQYYLSRDNIASSDDVLLTQGNGSSSVAMSGVGAGSTSGLVSSTLVMPSGLPAGWSGDFFYVVMKTDSAGQIAESNEANNAGQAGISLDWEPISVFAANPTNPVASQFTIALNISGMTASQRQIFQNAANRWSEIIVGDLPNQNFNGTVVDDVLIHASAQAIDGVGGILGRAGPDRLRTGTYLPYHGGMEFDSADLAAMEASGTLQSVIMHEMGHVLGIGTIWDLKGLLAGEGTTNPRFIGANATAAYNQLFGQSDTGVPVENGGGSGTRDSHWRETILNRELMTGYAESSGAMPLSRITAASLADLGYVVNMNAADSISASGSAINGAVSIVGSTSNSLLSELLAANSDRGCGCSLCRGMVSAAQFDQAKDSLIGAISEASQVSQISLATKSSQSLEKWNLGSRLSIIARDSVRTQHTRAVSEVFANETVHQSWRSTASGSKLSLLRRESSDSFFETIFVSEV